MADTLTADDITDRLIKGIVTADDSYFARADLALKDIAESLEVDPDDIAYGPNGDDPHYRVKQYLITKVGYDVCYDNQGISPQKATEEQVIEDPYAEKFKSYAKLLNDKSSQMTEGIIKNDADETEEYSSSSTTFYRR